MAVEINQLQRSLSCIVEEKDEFFRQGAFSDLIGELHYRIGTNQAKPDAHFDVRCCSVMRCLRFIQQDIFNLETLLDRLEWQRQLWKNDEISDGRWQSFTTADIDMFHVEFRSIFDYIAQLLQSISDTPGSVPTGVSFEKLTNWTNKSESNVARIGKDISDLVQQAGWFKELKHVRDQVVHRGGETLVFFEKPRILFQVHDIGLKGLIDFSEVAYNQNVIDFELYAAVFYGYLVTFLEDVATTVFKRLKLERPIGSTRHFNGGIKVAKSWLENAVERFAQLPIPHNESCP